MFFADSKIFTGWKRTKGMEINYKHGNNLMRNLQKTGVECALLQSRANRSGNKCI